MSGYRRIPAADVTEQGLRDRWYLTIGTTEHAEANQDLCLYIWRRAEAVVAADRLRHPKKLRNLPVPTNLVIGEGRAHP